jgi:hypothetical protein
MTNVDGANVPQARATEAKGEAAAAQHQADTEASLALAGSAEWQEPASTVDDVAVAAPGSEPSPTPAVPPTS